MSGAGRSGVLSVGQLNRYVKALLDEAVPLRGLMVRGEISNFVRHYKSGHMYFTLKDERASIKAVMFQQNARMLRFEPENGMSVILSGSATLYERDGSYQLYAVDMQPDGVGALHLAYEQLRDRLSREGLFDPARKRPIPPYPERIGIVTSEGAAALRDLLSVLDRRYPVARVVLVPAQVQGDGAAASVAAGIRRLCNTYACDVIIVGRGGGSIEDLWAFNDEALARVIAASEIPVISAVGHETDFTIADFAADLRAPTPSAAAELATPDIEEVRRTVRTLAGHAARIANRQLDDAASRLTHLRARVIPPRERLARQAERLVGLRRMADLRVAQSLREMGEQLARLATLAEERSPMRLLARGYTLTLRDGILLRRAAQAAAGDEITTRLTDGELVSTVRSVRIKEKEYGGKDSEKNADTRTDA